MFVSRKTITDQFDMKISINRKLLSAINHLYSLLDSTEFTCWWQDQSRWFAHRNRWSRCDMHDTQGCHWTNSTLWKCTFSHYLQVIIHSLSLSDFSHTFRAGQIALQTKQVFDDDEDQPMVDTRDWICHSFDSVRRNWHRIQKFWRKFSRVLVVLNRLHTLREVSVYPN